MYLIFSGITFWEKLTNASVNKSRIGDGGVNCLSNRVLKRLISYLFKRLQTAPKLLSFKAVLRKFHSAKYKLDNRSDPLSK